MSLRAADMAAVAAKEYAEGYGVGKAGVTSL
jgi:hypothetical protein